MLSPEATTALLALSPEEAERLLQPAKERAAKAIARAATLLPVEAQPGCLRFGLHINQAHAEALLAEEVERALLPSGATPC